MCTKKIAAVLRAISGSPHPKNFTSAVIVAAGLSERFGGKVTKQMTNVCGEPLLMHTVRAYEEADCIHEIIIVAKSVEIPVWQELVKKYDFKKVRAIVKGGHTRQISVLNGFEAIDTRAKYVAIADGARCLTTPDIINSVCRSAYKYKAATAAHRSTDTVKIADKKGFIDTTADRDTVWMAQTPQAFKVRLYRAAAYTALKKDIEVTDDNSLVESVGHPIRLVECGAQNIKITTREDLAVAEGILAERARARKEDQ
ncbi:MAG: 2-C-methyl-D-erythritol 4-phosphate cytidylyltransferase [Ruminococcaceae bacterium]|nr:2-C-methyl-D-erythritol 4-phosphate cytidylyltransferase [Oscillospiraceae bacterium]